MLYICWKYSGCPFKKGADGFYKYMKCLEKEYSIGQCKKDNYAEELDFFDKENKLYKIEK